MFGRFNTGQLTGPEEGTMEIREGKYFRMHEAPYSPNAAKTVVANIKATLHRVDKGILRATGVNPSKIKTPGDADTAAKAVQKEIANREPIRPNTPPKKRSDLHAVYLHLGALRNEL